MATKASLDARSRVEISDEVITGEITEGKAKVFGGLTFEDLKPFAESQNVNHEDSEGSGHHAALDPRVWTIARFGGVKKMMESLKTDPEKGVSLKNMQERVDT